MTDESEFCPTCHTWPELCECPKGPAEVNSWAPIDLGPYLRGEIKRPEPSVGLARSDGLRLIYPGKEHSVIGEMECGKSWFSLASVATELANSQHVVYIHFEECDPTDSIERLQALGVGGHTMAKLFRFVAPQRQVSTEDLRQLLDPAPSLVVLDGVNEAMSLHGWGIREEDGAAKFRRHLVMPCLQAGAATLACDHVVKDKESRGRNALGSIHKGNGINGALFLLENAEPFGRGARGRSHVYVTKDRPGHLRRHGRADKRTPGKTFMGELVVDDSQTYSPELELKFWAPKPPPTAGELAEMAEQQEDQDETLDSQILAVVGDIIERGQVANVRTVEAVAECRKQLVGDALARLVYNGRLKEESGPRNARIFTIPVVSTVPVDQDV